MVEPLNYNVLAGVSLDCDDVLMLDNKEKTYDRYVLSGGGYYITADGDYYNVRT